MKLIKNLARLDEIVLQERTAETDPIELAKRGLALLGLIGLYVLLGAIIARNTDYGRIFAFSMSSMTVCLLTYNFIFFNVGSLLFPFKDRQVTDQLVHLLQRTVHQTSDEQQDSPMITEEQLRMLHEVLSIVKKKEARIKRHANYATIVLMLSALSAFGIAMYPDFVDRLIDVFLLGWS